MRIFNYSTTDRTYDDDYMLIDSLSNGTRKIKINDLQNGAPKKKYKILAWGTTEATGTASNTDVAFLDIGPTGQYGQIPYETVIDNAFFNRSRRYSNVSDADYNKYYWTSADEFWSYVAQQDELQLWVTKPMTWSIIIKKGQYQLTNSRITNLNIPSTMKLQNMHSNIEQDIIRINPKVSGTNAYTYINDYLKGNPSPIYLPISGVIDSKNFNGLLFDCDTSTNIVTDIENQKIRIYGDFNSCTVSPFITDDVTSISQYSLAMSFVRNSTSNNTFNILTPKDDYTLFGDSPSPISIRMGSPLANVMYAG